MLDKFWSALIELGRRAAREERGDSLVNWLILAVGLAAAAAVVVALLRPAIENAANKIVSALG